MKAATCLLTGALCLGAFVPDAGAVDPFEIQVYEGDINDAGQAGLELHTNYTAAGRKTALYPGEVPPHGVARATLEPSFGVLPWWELGLYLQFAMATEDPAGHFGGFKLRSKFMAPVRHLGGPGTTAQFRYGLNMELGRGVSVFGGTDWGTEVRPILAYGRGRWLFVFNPIVGWAVTGDRHAAPEFEPAGKIRFDTRTGVGVGFEYYAGFGRLSDVPSFRGQEHILYVAGDLLDGPIDMNLAVGHGLTAASDDWSVKAIFGHAF